MRARILIAGIGNIFLGDDAFGVEVVARLRSRSFPESVRIVDFGIRGLDLAYALLEPYELVILVDAAPRSGQPGDLYVIEPDLEAIQEEGEMLIETHRMDPVRTLRMVATLGGKLDRVVVVGCEPTPLDEYADISAGLSEPVQQAVDRAVELICEYVEREAERPRQESETGQRPLAESAGPSVS